MANCEGTTNDAVNNLFTAWDDKPLENRSVKSECQDFNWNKGSYYTVTCLVDLLQKLLENEGNWKDSPLQAVLSRKPAYVGSFADWDPSKIGVLPKVLVNASTEKAQQDLSFYNQCGSNWVTGNKSYWNRWDIGHTIFVMAETLNETWLLKDLIKEYLHHMQIPITKSLGAVKFRIAEIGQAQVLSSDNSAATGYCCPISTITTVDDVWETWPDAPLLRRAKVTIE